MPSPRIWLRDRCPGGAGAAAHGWLLGLLLLLAPVARGAPAAAQEVFRDNCAPCHGPGGEGGIGPQLAGRPWTAQAVTARVRQGGLVMPAFSERQIPDSELPALVTYLSGLATPAASALLPAPSAKAAGAPLFQARCLACHGAEARGGIGPGILNTALPLPRFTRQVRNGGGMMPPFAAAQVSDAEVRQIYAYLHPPLSRPDPGGVEPLPAMPDYVGDLFFALAALALLAQAESERRRRVRLRVRAEAEMVRARIPAEELEPVRVRVF